MERLLRPAGEKAFRSSYLWFDVVVDTSLFEALDVLQHGLTSDVEVDGTMRIAAADAVTLIVDDERIAVRDELDAVTHAYGRVHRDLMREAHQRGYSRVHAATVDVEGSRIALVGPSGSGKTSLALELVRRGAMLQGDEALLLRDGLALALPRRLHAKSSGKEHIPAGLSRGVRQLPYTPEVIAIDPAALHEKPVRLRHAPVDLVVYFGALGATPEITAVTPADALSELLSDSGGYASEHEPLEQSQRRLVAETITLVDRTLAVRVTGGVAERADLVLRALG